MFLAL